MAVPKLGLIIRITTSRKHEKISNTPLSNLQLHIYVYPKCLAKLNHLPQGLQNMYAILDDVLKMDFLVAMPFSRPFIKK